MKEMMKSKGIIAFIIFILGVSYFSASVGTELELEKENDPFLVYNEQ